MHELSGEVSNIFTQAYLTDETVAEDVNYDAWPAIRDVNPSHGRFDSIEELKALHTSFINLHDALVTLMNLIMIIIVFLCISSEHI